MADINDLIAGVIRDNATTAAQFAIGLETKDADERPALANSRAVDGVALLREMLGVLEGGGDVSDGDPKFDIARIVTVRDPEDTRPVTTATLDAGQRERAIRT